jgi:integrase
LYNSLITKVKDPTKKPDFTVAEILAKYWTEEAWRKVSSKTIVKYLRGYKDFFGAHSKWSDISDARISEYVSKRRTDYTSITKGCKDGKKITYTDRFVSPNTINKELMYLGRINKLATKRWKLEPADFSIEEHRLETVDAKRNYLSEEEEQAIYSHLPAHWKPAFRYAMLTGVRAQSISVRGKDNAVKRKDISLQHRTIYSYGKSKKPGGKITEIPIVQELYDLLVDELNIEALTPDDYIFTYPKGHKQAGKPLGDYRAALYTAMEKAGFNRSRGEGMHITRHTVATRLVQSGIDITVAQELLGHADVKTTKIYAHRKDEQRRDAMEKALSKK